jgi:hypothetical protein
MMCAATLNWTLFTDIPSPVRYVMLKGTIGYTSLVPRCQPSDSVNNPQNESNEPRDQVAPGIRSPRPRTHTRDAGGFNKHPLLHISVRRKPLRRATQLNRQCLPNVGGRKWQELQPDHWECRYRHASTQRWRSKSTVVSMAWHLTRGITDKRAFSRISP